jgi:hypothetical protein
MKASKPLLGGVELGGSLAGPLGALALAADTL